MKFFSLLDKIGSGFKLGIEKALEIEANPKVIQAEQQIAGAVGLWNPALGVTLQGLIAKIGRVEQIAVALKSPAGVGDVKLQLAIPEVEQLILSDPLFKGKIPEDAGLWAAGVLAIADGLAKITNAVKSGEGVAASGAAPPPPPAS